MSRSEPRKFWKGNFSLANIIARGSAMASEIAVVASAIFRLLIRPCTFKGSSNIESRYCSVKEPSSVTNPPLTMRNIGHSRKTARKARRL